MKSFHEYWSFNAIRGVFALLAAALIVAAPRVSASFLTIPFYIAIAIAAYATYTIFDMAIMVILAKLLPSKKNERRSFYVEACLAFIFATLLFLVGYRILSLSWLMYIVALQAAVAAVAEFLVAEGTHRTYGCLSCYSSAIVLAVAALALPFAGVLPPPEMSLALAAYLSAVGLSELFLGSRMLFLEYRAEHPAKPISMDWRMAMEQAAEPAPVRFLPANLQAFGHPIDCVTALACDACPADTICSDSSLQGQLNSLLHTRQPSIVTTVRAASLLQARH
jgi:hypothetical protein